MSEHIQSIAQNNYILHNIDAKKLYVQEPLFTANSGDAVYVGWRPDETVLYSGAYNNTITSCPLSEPITNFQYIKVDWQRGLDAQNVTTLETSIYPSDTKQFNHIGKQNQETNYYYEYHAFWDVYNSTAVNHSRTFLVNYPKAGGNITTYQNDYNEVIPVKIVGINRKENA